ncbi:MAG TPA: O-antigen ligase family protein, partial [Opitutaceae bacterium]|nr:O-antigen ligase family protein [Opitutaceae bacterium]
ILYIMPTGLMMRELTDRGRGNGVLLGVVLFSFCLAAVGLEILHTVGVENLVKSIGLNLSRSNVENESYKYLHFFVITNVIIGMSTFGVCALTCAVVLILNAPMFVKFLATLGFALALYINVQVITRGAIVSAGVGVLFSLPWVALNLGPKRIARYSIVAATLLGALLAYGYFYKRSIWEKITALTERISESGDDTRLTHWNEAVRIIQRDVWGGGRGFMQTHTWAHNFFLDSGLTAGIPGILSVLALLILAFLQIARVLLRGRRALHPVFLVILALFFAILVLTMTSPPSLPLFGMLLLAAGFFARPFNRDTAYES